MKKKGKAKAGPISAYAIPDGYGTYTVSYFPPAKIDRVAPVEYLHGLCRTGVVVFVRSAPGGDFAERWEVYRGQIVKLPAKWSEWKRTPD